jgi:hypothetical protein
MATPQQRRQKMPKENELTPKDITKGLADFDKEFDSAERAEDFTGFELLEEGDYLLGVQDYNWFKSSQGNIGIKVEFVAIEVKNSAKIFHNFMITENNMPYLKRDLELLGIKIKSIKELQSVDFMGVACKAHVGTRQYAKPGEEPKTYNEINWFMQLTTEEREKVLGSTISREDIPNPDDLPF